MDGGGITRKRGYMWLAAVLVVVLLIVVYIGKRPQQVQYIVAAPDTAMADSVGFASQVPHRSQYSKWEKSSVRQSDARPLAAVPEPTPQTIYRKSNRLVVELNGADSLDLVQLYNVGPAFARRILKYRSLLGGFVEKGQLWEVYGMDSVRYNDIAPYVKVDCSKIKAIDINSASVDELKRHPYLDYYQAKAIVRLREESGLYKDISDLRKIAHIDNETYNKILPYLVCNSQPNK